MSNTLKFGNGEWYGKEGTILAYNDENNNYKPLPFNFERDSVATRVNKQGLIETVGADQPRIDYTDDSNGALLLEPSRTNSEPYSEEFSNAGWVKTNATITSNIVISPDGSLNATKIEVTSSGGNIFDPIGGTGDYVFSLFVKYVDTQYVRLRSTASYAFFDIKNGSVGGTVNVLDSKIENYGNGWYRCSVVGNNTNSLIQLFLSDSATSVTGTGSAYIWGAQLEQGSYPTSIINTQGSAQTRLADSCSQTPPDGVIGQTEGTMFFEIDFKNTSGVSGAWSISNASSANRITMNTTNLSSTQFTLSVAQNYNSGSTKLASSNVKFSDKHKVAIKYSGTTLKLFVDGQLSDSVSTDGFGNYTNFYVGGNQNGVGGDARKFIQANLYNTALSDSELAALTQV